MGDRPPHKHINIVLTTNEDAVESTDACSQEYCSKMQDNYYCPTGNFVIFLIVSAISGLVLISLISYLQQQQRTIRIMKPTSSAVPNPLTITAIRIVLVTSVSFDAGVVEAAVKHNNNNYIIIIMYYTI